MGCGASRSGDGGYVRLASNPAYIDVTDAWDRAWKTTGVKKGTKIKVRDLVIRRTGWKTIRIFVSSTFRDFHQEREILVKKVFPDLRLFCENHRLQLIECDLRWGVPKDENTEGTLRACLGEIDRCYDDNVMPFFVNMTSERVGWIPTSEEVPDSIKDEYKWVEGLSVTEMEIMHAAYRVDNPNALFLLRDPGFLEHVPDEYKKRFIESNTVAPVKLSMLRKMIHERFPPQRIHKYKVHYAGFNPDTNMLEFGGLEEDFAKKVLDFFKARIVSQYPLPNAKPDPYLLMKEQHESFMNSRAQSVFGRSDILMQVDNYICHPGNDTPFLVIGEAGTGKSSIMARLAEDTVLKALKGQIPGGKNKNWNVFYHFVGAVPGSTELEKLLKRLLLEMGVCNKSTIPGDLDCAVQLSCGALTNPNTSPAIIIIDALNQLDDDSAAKLVNWVPRKLAPQVRCVFSMIPDTPQHKSFISREPMPKILTVTPLDRSTREIIVTEMLGKYNKRLDSEQMETLLSKESSSNPLWLSMAVEELRVFGMFRKILDKINQLADGLLELEMQIIQRFVKESDPTLLIATLCLMEASSRGLLETELLSILAQEEGLMMREPEDKDADTEKDDSQRQRKSNSQEKLPAFKWANVYRNLKPFFRPFGDSGEGRLDFYHRSLSKAVRRLYFKDEEGNDRPEVYKWWHTHLANFFETCTNKKRKLEEYPVHLMAIEDHSRLEAFLTEWSVFDALYDEEFSGRLVALWRKSVGFERMEDAYMTVLNNFANSGKNSKKEINARRICICRFFGQAGRFATASKLVEQAIKIEKEELEGKDEDMAQLYHLNAIVLDEIMKMEDYMYRSQLPKIMIIIENFEKAAELRKKLKGEEHKTKLGMIKNRLAFYYSGVNLRGGTAEMSAASATEKAEASVEEAIKIFTELKDQVHLADSLTTKGVTYGHAVPEQIKAYKEAEALLIQTVGEVHHLLDRLYLNMAIYYEELGNYYDAFNHFYKWYQISIDLYGAEHPRSRRCISTLREPMYRRILTEKGLPVPELPVDDA